MSRFNRRIRKPKHYRGPVPDPEFLPTDFPKPWLYYGTNGFGNPVMGTTGLYEQGSFNQANVDAMSRFSLVTLNAHPFASTGPGDSVNRGIVSLLKTARPTMKILWYDTFVQAITYLNVGSQWHEISDLSIGPPDVRLYDTGGLLAPWLDQDVWFFDTGVVKAALLAIWLSKGGSAHDADGFFLDYAWGVLNVNTESGDPVDITRTAWSTGAELDASAKAGLDYVVDGMTAAGFEVWGNGVADVDSKSRWTGSLYENWDPDFGLTGSSAPGGFATFDLAMASLLGWQGSTATGDGTGLVYSSDNGVTWNTNRWFKEQRFDLGSATVAGGYGATQDRNNNVTNSPADEFKWADEYCVVGGVSQTTGANGWLGRPTEFGYKDSGGCWIRHFDNGMVILNGDGSTSHSFDPGSGYRTIRGIYQTSVNDGTAVTGAVTVPGKDARFLLRA